MLSSISSPDRWLRRTRIDRSCISDSDPVLEHARIDRFTVALLCTVLALLALIEAASVVGFDRTSKVQRREVLERQTLLGIRDSEASNDPHIAVIGNSLMLEGVDVSLLRTKIEPTYTPVPYLVLGTNYYDWFFGLKRLFAEGMRPRYVLLGLSPNQLAASGIKGDYSARYLFQQSDLIDVVRKTHMDATSASGFLLAHYSEYYSTREITRGFFMSRVLPGVGEFLHSRVVAFRDPEIKEAVLEPLAADRLAALDQLCRAHGAHFLLVVPPSYQKGAEILERAGSERGVTVLVPVAEDEFDASYYQSDGIHLNDKGAQVFTTRLAASLREHLPNLSIATLPKE
jgi:hypothetical protein